MIPDLIKDEIQTSYRKFLNNSGHKPRSGQKQMIAAIARCLMHSQAKSKIIAVEAGTGTGKTLAYLLAALPIAREQGKTLVVSTGTIALQEQLVYKDIPDLIAKGEMNFGYSLIKGRGRYLCHLKLDQLLSGSDDDQMAMYLDGEGASFKKMTIELYQAMYDQLRHKDWDGDRDSWDDTIDESDWRPLTSDRYQCLGRSCPHVSDCAFFNARNDLEEVSCLVTNHDLVLSDLALGGGAILPPPEDCIYVFDEAHHLGDKARNHFSTRFRAGSSIAFFQQLEEHLPKLSEDLNRIQGIGSIAGEALSQIQPLLEQLQRLRIELASLFPNKEHLSESTEIRFKLGEIPQGICDLGVQIQPIIEKIDIQISRLSDKLEDHLATNAETEYKKNTEIWFPVVGQWLARTSSYTELWHNLVKLSPTRSSEFARWCRYYPASDDYELFSSPIIAGDILQEQLWKRGAGAVLTSATLTALGRFDRFKQRAGLPDDYETLILLSPFDYPNRASLCIPSNAPDPKEYEAHDQYLIDELPNILDPGSGNLVLFSSARQMDEVYENLEYDFQKRVLIQGARSKQRLITEHKKRIDEGEGSTIFGLASFAEGVDLPGAYCEHVVIAKIPFSVPTEPEEEAFAEWVEANGGRPFFEISLPDASMRLVQATGRLLRSDTDEGKISILDTRLNTKSYGRQLIAALPPYSLENI